MTRYDLALVSCGAQKADSPQLARHLYRSTLFRLSLEHAEAQAARVLILSARHGLVSPDQQLAPYDASLRHLGPMALLRWLQSVHETLPVPAGRVLLLAGGVYLDKLRPELVRRGWQVDAPLERLTIGRRLQWLVRARRDAA